MQALGAVDLSDVQQCQQLLVSHTQQCCQVLEQVLGLHTQAAQAQSVALQLVARRCFEHGVQEALAVRDQQHAEQVRCCRLTCKERERPLSSARAARSRS